MDEVRVRLLGGLRIEAAGQPVKVLLTRSQRSAGLMSCLLLHRGEAVSAQELTRALWPGASSASPETALKTLVSRLRDHLDQISPRLSGCLSTLRGGYCWSRQAGVAIDLDEFEPLADSLTRLGAIDPCALAQLRRLISLYRGGLVVLPRMADYLAPYAAHFSARFEAAVTHCLDLLETGGEAREASSLCRAALDAAPDSTALRLRLTALLLQTDRQQAADQHYQAAVSAQSPEASKALLTRLAVAEDQLTEHLSGIRERLCQPIEEPGAVICDRDVFSTIFRLSSRLLERMGGGILLGVILMTGLEGQPLLQGKLMAHLTHETSHSLRRGDTVSRVRVNEIAVLLPMTPPEAGQQIMERLKAQFYRAHPSCGCTLVCGVIPLDVAPAEPNKKGTNEP